MKEFLSLSMLVDYLEEHQSLLEKPYLIEIEYSKDNWRTEYPLEERIYQTTTICGYFDSDTHSSLIGNTRSGSEVGVNLSLYNWKVANIVLYDEKPLR